MSLINYQKIKKELTNQQKLIAVSKGQDISKIRMLYDQGHRDFGENYLQELIKKSKVLPADIHWHFLGKIQTNKIKNIIQFSSLIHSVSRKKVYQKILNTHVKKQCNFLLQLKLGNEDSKDGLSTEELIKIVEDHDYESLFCIRGIMGIAENNISEKEKNNQFQICKELFLQLKENYKNIDTLSLGMSSDYSLAISYGSTMVRIGTKIFGNRR